MIYTLIQRRFVKVDSSIQFNVETTLILGWIKKQFCSHIMILKKIKSLYYRWQDNCISTSKQRQLINFKSTSKFDVETTVDFGLTLKTILFSYHDAWKIKIFISRLKRWPYFNAETTSPYQRQINDEIWRWNNVDLGLTLKNNFTIMLCSYM